MDAHCKTWVQKHIELLSESLELPDIIPWGHSVLFLQLHWGIYNNVIFLNVRLHWL